MEIGPYLAMTAAEFAASQQLPSKIAWMACHFSPYGTGLSNLPPALPSGSLLILNDRVPLWGHDPGRITAQLDQAVETLDCSGLLLDFQQQDNMETKAMAEFLISSLPCPVAVSEICAEGLDCPVFLSPCPHHTHLKEHMAPWAGREVWLDLAVDAETISLTKDGCTVFPLPMGEIPEGGFCDEALHCHYRTEVGEDFARFTLWRTREDLRALAREAEELGVKSMVGLWQEWQAGK